MRKRWLLAAGTMAALVGVVLVGVTMMPCGPGVTKANFDNVEDGMTEKEVEEIFGEPANDRWRWFSVSSSPYMPVNVIWRRDDGACATITFSGRKVIGKGWSYSEETVPAKLRRWLRL